MRDEHLTPKQRKELEQEATEANADGVDAFRDGKYKKTLEAFELALEIRRRLYPKYKYPDGHPDLATSLDNMGSILEALGRPDEALPHYHDALAMRRHLYPEDEYPDGHPDLATSLNNMGFVLQALGRLGEALPHYHDALATYASLYSKDKYPGGHPDIATSLSNLGTVFQGLGHLNDALSHYYDALAMRRHLYPEDEYPDGHPDLATSLNNLGTVLEALGRPDEALPRYHDALAVYRSLYPKETYPDGHPDLASCLNNLGSALQALGRPDEALPRYHDALAMYRRFYPEDKFPNGHPDLASCLGNMGSVFQRLGRSDAALSHYYDALAMRRHLYPKETYHNGHPNLATSLNNMGTVLEALGRPDEALPRYHDALAMYGFLYPKDKYPDGHLDLAFCLDNLGAVLQGLGRLDEALPHYRDALVMRRHLYPTEKFPDGHPDLATSLNNMGFVLQALGRLGEALPYYHDALAMYGQLYPKGKYAGGHPDLATSLNNMGSVTRALGRSDEALAHYHDALAMHLRLYPKDKYPDGHPDLATSLDNMGFVLEALGKLDEAASRFDESIAMRLPAINRAASSTSDATTLASVRNLKAITGGLLSALRAAPSKLNAAYARLWKMRAPLLTALRTRHDAALIQRSDTLVRKQWDRLTAVRAAISRLMTDLPADFFVRDKALAELDDEQEALQRKLAPLLPTLKRDQELASATPEDLVANLPEHSALIEFIRYARWEKGTAIGEHYVAFIVPQGREPICIDLNNAQPIDDAIDSWRASIDRREASIAPAKLRALVWEPVAKHLPAATSAVYLCPDGDLARLPFAALPGQADGTVLLEDHALAVVPSGLYLLEHCLYAHTYSTNEEVLTVGQVTYGEGEVPYAHLTETGREANCVRAAFGLKPDEFLAGFKATPKAVAEGLRATRYAHLATHGYFDADALTKERMRFDEHLKTWQAGFDSSRNRVGVGMRNPLGYVGLALAGANDPKAGGILTGLDIVDLPLEDLKLCVLSACETGLGALTEGEGVAGLQRAFHVAGCPNVVGSLWKVNDKATAALMAQFYHEHRANKRPVIEALRRAQLAVYRHPERIDDLAGDRARIALEDAVRLEANATAPEGPKATPQTTPTKLWAAFVLSGLGR